MSRVSARSASLKVNDFPYVDSIVCGCFELGCEGFLLFRVGGGCWGIAMGRVLPAPPPGHPPGFAPPYVSDEGGGRVADTPLPSVLGL